MALTTNFDKSNEFSEITSTLVVEGEVKTFIGNAFFFFSRKVYELSMK